MANMTDGKLKLLWSRNHHSRIVSAPTKEKALFSKIRTTVLYFISRKKSNYSPSGMN